MSPAKLAGERLAATCRDPLAAHQLCVPVDQLVPARENFLKTLLVWGSLLEYQSEMGGSEKEILGRDDEDFLSKGNWLSN